MSRVLHVINHLGCGGAENLVRGMARHLCARGWQVTVCALGEPVSAAADLDLRCLGAKGPGDVAGYLRLRRLLRELRPELVHVHLLWAELWGLPAARAVRAPVIIHGHCTYDARADSRAARLCSRALTRRAAATIAISRAVARYRVACCGDASARVRVVHNGVELADFGAGDGARRRARARWGLSPEEPVAGTVARLHPVKGVEVFIGAAALVARWHPGARFLVVGDGPERARLRALATELGLDGRVVFTGELATTQAHAALAAMDLFVLPSLREGLGLAVIEAMAAGRAVVASDCEGIAEVVEDGRSGLLFAPGDARALAGKLDLLLRRPQLARRLAAAARERVRDRFSLPGMVSQVEAVYRAAMGARKGADAARDRSRDRSQAAGGAEIRPYVIARR